MKLIPNFLPIVLMSPVAVLAQSVPFEAPDLPLLRWISVVLV